MSYLEEGISSYKKPFIGEEAEEDQKFDYTRGRNSAYNNSMFGAARSPNQGSPWAFIDVINPKKHALTIAKELDHQRGVPTDNSKDNANDSSETSNNSDTTTNKNSNGNVEVSSSQTTIRRLPSGAKPTTNGHTIQETTPVRPGTSNPSNPDEHSLSDVVGQSTPLSLEKNHRTSSRNSFGHENRDYDEMIKETHWLHEEIASLKDQLIRSESQRVDKEAKVSELNEQLQNTLKEKKNTVGALESELRELKEQWSVDNERKASEMDEKRQIEKKNQEIIKELKQTQQIERDSLVGKLAKLDTNWNQTLDKEKQKLMKEMDALEAEYDRKINEFQENLEGKIRLLGVSDEALRNKTHELDCLRKDFYDKNEELTEFKKKLEDKNTDLAEKCKELNELRSEFGFLREDFRRQKNELAEVKENLESKNTELIEKRSEFQEFQSEFRSLRKEFRLQDEELAESERILQSTNAELTRMSKESDRIQSELKQREFGLQNDLKDKDDRLKELDKVHSELKQKEISLQNDLKVKDDRIIELDKVQFELKQRETRLQNDSRAKDDRLKELDELHSELKQRETRLQNDSKAKDDRLKELAELHSELKQREISLQNDLKARDDQIRELTKIQPQLKEKEISLQNDLKAKDDRVRELDKMLSELKQREISLQNDLRVKDDQIRELTKIQPQLEKKEISLQNDLKARDERVKGLSECLRQKEKEFGVKLSAKNDELLGKLRELDLLQESKKEISAAGSQLELRLKKSEIQNKKKEEILQKQSLVHDEQISKMKQSLEDERRSHNDLKVNMEEMDQFAQEFSQYIEDLELFGVKLGNLIVDTFKKNHKTKDLDPFFTNVYKDVTGFHRKQHDTFSQEMQSKINTLELKNKELLIQIEHQWKSKLENEHQELEQRKLELKKLDEKFNILEQKSMTLQTKIETYQEEKAILLKEKEAVVRNNVSLSEEISNYRSNLLNKDQERFLQLVSKVEEQSHLISKLQSCSVELESLRKQLQHQSSQLQQLQGDSSRKITFAVARRSRPDINATIYENLMVSKVDSIDMVELQNIVKNLILLLDIPFNKLTKKSPLVAIYLKYERPIFTHFANRLHLQMFNEPIDMKRFANDAYDQYSEDHDMRSINHPLHGCLDNLYQRLISRVSRK